LKLTGTAGPAATNDLDRFAFVEIAWAKAVPAPSAKMSKRTIKTIQSVRALIILFASGLRRIMVPPKTCDRN
jgi:hypothetical protein